MQEHLKAKLLGKVMLSGSRLFDLPDSTHGCTEACKRSMLDAALCIVNEEMLQPAW